MTENTAQPQAIKAAGFVLVAQHTGTACVLLGRDKYRRRFGLLAGQRAWVREPGLKKRRESPYETAVRETMEESRGYWDSAYLTAHSRSDICIQHGHFMLYKAVVAFVPIDAIKAQQIPRFSLAWAPYREMSDYAWVSVQEIIQQTGPRVSTVDGRQVRVHRALSRELTQAQQLGWFEP